LVKTTEAEKEVICVEAISSRTSNLFFVYYITDLCRKIWRRQLFRKANQEEANASSGIFKDI